MDHAVNSSLMHEWYCNLRIEAHCKKSSEPNRFWNIKNSLYNECSWNILLLTFNEYSWLSQLLDIKTLKILLSCIHWLGYHWQLIVWQLFVLKNKLRVAYVNLRIKYIRCNRCQIFYLLYHRSIAWFRPLHNFI